MADEIWLVRHGATEWSVTGQHTGRTDLPLTAQGEREAARLIPILAERHFATVLCSPLRRARRTCEICGFAERARIEPDCTEWDYGEVNGLARDQYRSLHPGWIIWDGPVPGGESLDDVARRARRVLAELALIGGRALIFAHGHLLRILTAVYLELEPAAARHFALASGHVSVLGRDAGEPAMLSWNR
jgi:probable phosphoglycerate mutase